MARYDPFSASAAQLTWKKVKDSANALGLTSVPASDVLRPLGLRFDGLVFAAPGAEANEAAAEWALPQALCAAVEMGRPAWQQLDVEDQPIRPLHQVDYYEVIKAHLLGLDSEDHLWLAECANPRE